MIGKHRDDRLIHMNIYLFQHILAIAVLGLQIAFVIGLLIHLIKKQTPIHTHFQKHGMKYGLFIALAAMLGSLTLSEIYLLPACKLCWIQRIFHYPQVIIFIIALKYRDTRAWTYSLWLSILGLIVGAYQVLIQFSPKLAESSVCNIVPAAESCSDTLIQVFGYITIPVMSVTLYLSLILIYFLSRKNQA